MNALACLEFGLPVPGAQVARDAGDRIGLCLEARQLRVVAVAARAELAGDPGWLPAHVGRLGGQLKKAVDLTPFNPDPSDYELFDAAQADDILYGGAGDDVFHLGPDGSTDQIAGGTGRDTYRIYVPTDDQSPGAGRVSDFTAGDGCDVIAFEAPGDWNGQYDLEFSRIFLVQQGADVFVYYSYPNGGYATLLQLENVDGALLTLDNFQNFDGRSPILSDGSVIGTEGDDELGGSPFDDVIEGRGGNDLLIGGSGGADTVSGGAGDDVFDLVSSDDAGDTLSGGEGRDTYVIQVEYEENDEGEMELVLTAPDMVTDFSAGDDSVPRTAVAAATGMETKWVRPPLPWRPSKLRFDVEAQRSPGSSVSGFIPRHIEQPAPRHSKPAARKISSSPSASACSFTRPEPGTIMALTRALTVLPSTTLAAARRSSMRPLVQEPMNTRSSLMSVIFVPAVRPI